MTLVYERPRTRTRLPVEVFKSRNFQGCRAMIGPFVLPVKWALDRPALADLPGPSLAALTRQQTQALVPAVLTRAVPKKCFPFVQAN
jgi:hypothetical protein